MSVSLALTVFYLIYVYLFSRMLEAMNNLTDEEIIAEFMDGSESNYETEVVIGVLRKLVKYPYPLFVLFSFCLSFIFLIYIIVEIMMFLIPSKK